MQHNNPWRAYLRAPEGPARPIDRRLLRRVGGWVRPYGGRIAAMVALLLVVSLIELAPPLLYGQLVDRLTKKSLTPGDLNLIALGLLGVPILASLLSLAGRYFSAGIGEGLIYELRAAMYAHMERMGLRYFTQTKTGDILSRFTNDVVGAQNAVTGTIPNLLTSVLTLVTTLGIMLRLEWRLTVVALVALPFFILPTRHVGKRLRVLRREAAGHDARMASQVQETLGVSGALLVRSFGGGARELGRFTEAAGAVRDIGIKRAVVGRWFFFAMGLAGAVGTALMYWVGGSLALKGELEVGLIVTFAAYVGRLYGPVSSLSNLQVEFLTSLVSFERVFEILDLPVELAESPHAVDPPHLAGRVAFEDVRFSYGVLPPSLQGHPTYPAAAEAAWALDGVSFTAEPGQLVALVGPSGAGKTTTGYLMARLYDPTEGRITLDGVDLRDYRLDSLARFIGVVTQETFLFHDSIRANLRFARPEATEEELLAACRAARLGDLLAALPEGLDTMVGERGYRLSGGEKQRLALARVILKAPPVLILDEATSHLDSQSEALIQEALDDIRQGRTSLVIAHRLSTILAADQILVLDGGRIVERGRHAELLAQGGLYAELFATQFRDAEPAPVDG
jgi:ATP-binding cassette subfamily B protein